MESLIVMTQAMKLIAALSLSMKIINWKMPQKAWLKMQPMSMLALQFLT